MTAAPTSITVRPKDRLLAVAWWDWSVEKISRNLDAIRGADIGQLEAAR